MAQVTSCFARRETRLTCKDMVDGLLSGLEDRTCSMLAEAAGHDRPCRMQHRLFPGCRRDPACPSTRSSDPGYSRRCRSPRCGRITANLAASASAASAEIAIAQPGTPGPETMT